MTNEPSKRCPFSSYNRIAYCNICDITCKACDGEIVDCEHYVHPYGEEIHEK